MADRLEAMALLVAVVDEGGFSAAARQLGLPVATVSRKVSELEGHLQTRLLQRSTRQLSLTDAGRSYIEACRRVLEDVSEMERAAAGEYVAPKGDLVVTAPLVFGRLHVLPVVADFLKTYPDIDVRLVLGDRIAHLLEEHIDVAVRIGPLPDSNLVALRAGAVRQVACAGTDYLAARGTPKLPTDLTRHDCITYEGLYSAQSWTFRHGEHAATVPIRSRLTVNGAEAAIDAATAGLGVTRVLSYQCAQAVTQRQLALVLEAYEPEPWPVSLVYGSQGRLPLKQRAFLDFALPLLRARLAG